MLRNEYLLDYMNLMNYVTNGVNNRFSIFYLSSWRIQIGTTKVYVHTFNKKRTENNSSPEINSHNTYRRHVLNHTLNVPVTSEKTRTTSRPDEDLYSRVIISGLFSITICICNPSADKIV